MADEGGKSFDLAAALLRIELQLDELRTQQSSQLDELRAQRLQLDELRAQQSSQLDELRAQRLQLDELRAQRLQLDELRTQQSSQFDELTAQISAIDRKLTRLGRRLHHVEKQVDLDSVDAAMMRRAARSFAEPARGSTYEPQTIPASQGHVFDPSDRIIAPPRWG